MLIGGAVLTVLVNPPWKLSRGAREVPTRVRNPLERGHVTLAKGTNR